MADLENSSDGPCWCPGSGHQSSPRAIADDGKLHCPRCNAVVGANRNGQIKRHRYGQPTRVITGGGRMRNYQ